MAEQETNWDFADVPTDRLTHGIHPYPAKLAPRLAEAVVKDFGDRGGVMMDPFAGSGTSLLEANLGGMRAIGFDINPLAVLISRVKTTPIPAGELDNSILEYRQGIDGIDPQSFPMPRITNGEYWFGRNAEDGLRRIAGFIETRGEWTPEQKRFFNLAFSKTVRVCSWANQREFKLMRIAGHLDHAPNPVEVMDRHLEKAAAMVGALAEVGLRAATTAEVADVNDGLTRSLPPIDLILSSPPYGDSRTTVAYGLFSRLSNEWMGVRSAGALDGRMIGGRLQAADAGIETEVAELTSAVAEISDVDGERARRVKAFFVDYEAVVRECIASLRPGGVICFVTGDRRVRGVSIPLAAVTGRLFRAYGCEVEKVVRRRIPRKRMPSANSPDNSRGNAEPTIMEETVTIARKRSEKSDSGYAQMTLDVL